MLQKIKKQYEFVMEAVKISGCELENASNELRNNYEIVMNAIKQSG
jgi:hypothetical protein